MDIKKLTQLTYTTLIILFLGGVVLGAAFGTLMVQEDKEEARYGEAR